MTDPTDPDPEVTALPVEPTPQLPTNWAVKAIDVSSVKIREGYNLPPGWQPLGIFLRGTQPVLVMYQEI